MNFFDINQSGFQGNDDTLIAKLKGIDFDEGTHRRSFGVEISNTHNDQLYVSKKPHMLQDFDTNEIQQERICIDGGNLPSIEKDYRLAILTSLVEEDKPITISHHHQNERNLVVNWLVLIHSRYPFETQTLHEAVRIFDQFICSKSVQIQNYQKYALTSYWMSAKMQQRKVRQLKIWISFGKGYVLEQILTCQNQIFETLGFKLISNTSQRFLFNFATFFPLQQKAFILCNYLLQLTLLNCSFIKYPSSIIALSCLLVCGKVLRKQLRIETISSLIQRMVGIFNLSIKSLYQCSKKVCRALQSAPDNPLNSVYRKYSSSRYLRISLIKLGKA